MHFSHASLALIAGIFAFTGCHPQLSSRVVSGTELGERPAPDVSLESSENADGDLQRQDDHRHPLLDEHEDEVERDEPPRGELVDSLQRALGVGDNAPVHLVLEAGYCFELRISGLGANRASLEDEYGENIAIFVADSPSTESVPRATVCPRWTGSFVLQFQARASSEMTLHLYRRSAEAQ